MSEHKLCYGCMEYTIFSGGVCPNCGYYEQAKPDPTFILPGAYLHDRYLVGIPLSANGEGVTYIAYDESIRCRVLIREYMPQNLCTRVQGTPVISVNSAHLAAYKALMAEFTELNKSLARLRGQIQTNPIVDLFSENNTTYIVFEYIEGIKFIDYLKDNAGELSWAHISRMLPPFLTTLSLLHNSGVVHRAISPETIYVSDKNELKITDFSIAATRTANTELECEIYGGYAAPEQYSASNRQGTWTDVYAVCAVLYRVLTGSMPTSAISRIENDNLIAPCLLNPNIPQHVSDVIMNGLNLVSNDRIQTITELVTDLFDEHSESIQNLNNVYQSAPAYTAEQYDNYQQQQYNQDNQEDTDYQDDYDDYQQKSNEYTDDYSYDTPYDDYGNESYHKEEYVIKDNEGISDRIRLPLVIGVILLVILLICVVIFVKGKIGTEDNINVPSITTVSTEKTDSSDDSELITGNSVMPELVGKNYENQAERCKDWIRFEVEEVFSDEYEDGFIVWQEYEAGSYFDSNEPVKIKVSKGPSKITLPSYSGVDLETYLQELNKLGVLYKTQDEVNESVQNGYVTRLSIHDDEKYDLESNTEITVYYANNPIITDPPATEPPTEPSTDAPVTDPPATDPPATDPPAVDPTDNPVE